MLVVPVPGDLPVECRDVTAVLEGIAAITFDFGNTLVPVSRAALGGVVGHTADAICTRFPEFDRTSFLATWAEERERQFREDVPQFREVDLAERLLRVFARLRGVAAPARDERWDDALTAGHAEPAVIDWAVETYSRAFVDALPETPGVGDLLARLARDRGLAIVSNWPLAATIDQYAEARGWMPYLRAIVVSQRVGTIKPRPAIFEAARLALGSPEPSAILHVGDDWAADVVGAHDAGWRTAWISSRPDDSPLPSGERDSSIAADLELRGLDELESHLGAPIGPPRPAAAR
ncbi:MAG: HAD family hydrolase [Chloroflexi bacterium]|nr:HAD family hydrolase [Chloroflexota bacterium]